MLIIELECAMRCKNLITSSYYFGQQALNHLRRTLPIPTLVYGVMV